MLVVVSPAYASSTSHGYDRTGLQINGMLGFPAKNGFDDPSSL